MVNDLRKPDRGWAVKAHIPALRSLPQYELRAISTSRRASADEAGRKFRVPLAFDNHADLVAHVHQVGPGGRLHLTDHLEHPSSVIASHYRPAVRTLAPMPVPHGAW